MTFLIVDQCQERLQALSDQLHALFPDCPVILETDPLLAGDYCFSNPVDVLYAGWHMKWLDGPKLAAFARRGNPYVRVYLLGDADQKQTPPGVSGLLTAVPLPASAPVPQCAAYSPAAGHPLG